MIKGVYTALVTPLKEDGSVDYEGLERLFDYQLEAKVDGIVVLGTTGESPTLKEDEQKEIIKAAVKHLKGKIHVCVGTGSYSTEQTIEKTKKAEALGADSALIVTPYYNKPTQEGLYRHFEAVSKNSSLPIIVYNIQGRTGQNIQTDTLKRIADLQTVVSVKEASGNVGQMMDVIETVASHKEGFSVLSGDDNLTLPLIALGGHGIVSVVSNLVPVQIKELCQLALDGQFAKARSLHYSLSPLFKAAFIETNPIPIKALMELCGLPAGSVRLPLCEASAETLQKLKHLTPTLEKWLNEIPLLQH